MRSHQYFCECGVTLASVFLCKVLIIVICIFLAFSCLFDCMNFDCSFGISVDFSQKSIANKANLFFVYYLGILLLVYYIVWVRKGVNLAFIDNNICLFFLKKSVSVTSHDTTNQIQSIVEWSHFVNIKQYRWSVFVPFGLEKCARIGFLKQ